MTLRVITTIIILLFAIGALCSGGPAKVSPTPFGFFFLGLATLVWFSWKPASAGLDQRESELDGTTWSQKKFEIAPSHVQSKF